MRTKILPPTPENIALTAASIQNGEVVGIPTETVYGLAGDCRNPLAVARIFETKERPTFDPLIVHVGFLGKSVEGLERLQLIDSSRIAPSLRQQLNLLIQHFWPGPLTLVLPKHPSIPDLVSSGLETIALRMPQHPVAQALIAASGTSLAAPSANRFGRISPTTSAAVLEELGDRIDWILEGGPCQIGLESTILRFNEEGNPEILRQGGTPQEKIEALLKTSVVARAPSAAPKGTLNSSHSPLLSPGLLESHYAPKKSFFILPKRPLELQSSDLKFLEPHLKSLSPISSIGLLLMEGTPELASQHISQLIGHPVIARTLSPQGDLPEAAKNLFAEMRHLDSLDIAWIVSEPCLKSFGLGHAIADRMKRASAPRHSS